MNVQSNSFMSEAAAAVAANHPMTRKDAMEIIRFMFGMALMLSMLIALL